jgi:hypothetical protein
MQLPDRNRQSGAAPAQLRSRPATDQVRSHPNPDALARLAGAVLAEAHDEWQVAGKRHLSEGLWQRVCVPYQVTNAWK